MSNDKADLMKEILAHRAREEERARKRRMQAGEVEITLINAADDPALFSAENQSTIQEVIDALRNEGIQISAPFMVMDAVDAMGGAVGELLIPFVQVTAPTVGVVLAAWIHGRFGRKVRIEIGDTKAEAKTVEEIDRLLKLAAQHHERIRSGKE